MNQKEYLEMSAEKKSRYLAQQQAIALSNAWSDNIPSSYWEGMRPISKDDIKAQYAIEGVRNIHPLTWGNKEYAKAKIRNQPFY